MTKSIIKSKTIWYNLALLFAAFLFKDNFQMSQEIFLGLFGIGNIALRAITVEKVVIKVN